MRKKAVQTVYDRLHLPSLVWTAVIGRLYRTISLTLSLLLATSLFAHHSPAVFDRSREIKLTGTVKEFRWTNPHSWIELDVRNAKGETEAWAVEMTTPSQLVKAGWKSTTVKGGDEVTIVAHPLRTDEKVGQFVSITLADGKVLTDRAN